MKNDNYKILALKYRPKNFNELIGQDIKCRFVGIEKIDIYSAKENFIPLPAAVIRN